MNRVTTIALSVPFAYPVVGATVDMRPSCAKGHDWRQRGRDAVCSRCGVSQRRGAVSVRRLK